MNIVTQPISLPVDKPSVDIVKPRDYRNWFSPPIKPSTIQEVKKELQETLNDDERQLLQYCMTMIIKETKKTGQSQWNDVTITIIFNRGWKIVISTKSDYDAANEYEVLMDYEGPIHTITKQAPSSSPVPVKKVIPPTSVPVDKVIPPKPSVHVVKPRDYRNWFSPPMRPSTIQAVLKELRETLNEEERQLLQHCMTMIIKETEKTGQSQWNDVTITILFNRGWKIVISTKSNYATTNEYEVFMDYEGPTYKMTKKGWTESAWSGYSYLPSMSFFGTAAKAIGWW